MKISNVAGGNPVAVHQCGGGYEGIALWPGIGNMQSRRSQSDPESNIKNLVLESGDDLLAEPVTKYLT